MYLTALNFQSSICSIVITALVFAGTDLMLSIIYVSILFLMIDLALKSYYADVFRKTSIQQNPNSQKQRKRMWLEFISIIKDILVLIPSVIPNNKIILAITRNSPRYFEVCHLISSMVLLVYFVVTTYFMVSQALCVEYSVPDRY